MKDLSERDWGSKNHGYPMVAGTPSKIMVSKTDAPNIYIQFIVDSCL
mgnify:CR=1 FL=1